MRHEFYQMNELIFHLILETQGLKWRFKKVSGGGLPLTEEDMHDRESTDKTERVQSDKINTAVNLLGYLINTNTGALVSTNKD